MSLEPGLHGVRMQPRDAMALIYAHGWTEPLNMARMIATLIQESSLFTEAVGPINDDGTQDIGLFQLNSSHWNRYATSLAAFITKAFDPPTAAAIARDLWNEDKRLGGDGFRPWAAFTSGAYKDKLPTACLALANFASMQLLGKTVA